MNNYTFNVKMSCYGCVGAVIKALSSANINTVDVDFDNQLVKVKSEKSCNDVLNSIEKSGKKAIIVS